MNAALIGQVGVVLGSIGAAFQYLRAFRAFPEWAYYAVAVPLSVAALLFVNESALAGPRAYMMFFVANWPLFLTFLGTIMSGTKAASDAAKGGVKVIPMTDSK